MHLLIFGLGYTATRLAHRLGAEGWQVTATSRSGAAGTHAIDSPQVSAALRSASHILSSVPPADGSDPVLSRHAAALASAPAGWVGYLSSTGVYGDTGGAWVDETAALGGRRSDRIAADRAWQALRPDVRVLRLPGIYGPGRSALDQLRRNSAHRVDAPAQRFSRIHVDDIVGAICAAFVHGPPGVYNLADAEPATGRHVTEYAADLLGVAYPPLIAPDSPALSPMARGFYTESRVVTAAKAARLIGFRPAYPNYRAGLRACFG
jgi:nucleoside-diphosphate-sugar epimerase